MLNQIISAKGSSFVLAIGQESGRMEHLDIAIGNLGQWNTIPGHIEVVDDLTRNCYRDGRDKCVVAVHKKKTHTVVISKRFQGAVFTIQEEWTVAGDEMQWKITVTLDKDEAPRSIKIRQFIPYPTNEPYRWNVWTAQQHFPKELVRVAQSSMVYGDICCGTVIPLLALYSEHKDVGMSIAKPLGQKIPRWTMIFDGYRGGGVTIESGCMKLSNNHSAETALLLHPYAGGCWRPALGYLVQKYPSYFKAGLADASERLDGGFLIGNPSTAETQMQLAKTYDAKVAEIHHHYRYYGNYFPDHGTWRTIEGNPVRETIRKNVRSVKTIRQALQQFNSHQIKPLLYIQLAGDGYRSYVEKKFPESIALNIDGQRMGQNYYNVWMMNSDLSLPFGKFLHEELERFFRLYPEAGGLFWDQPCYDDIDSAHHDGLTMVDNKPMYRLAFCYEEHRDYMVSEAHKRKMIISANGPLYIELCEEIDQIMAEGVSWVADVVQYECVARPMLFYHYFKDADDVEEMFQKCLIAGATGYTVPDFLLSPDLELLFRSYTPLVRLLSGRTWLFEPRPLELPRRVDGNIFSKEDGSLYVTLVSRGQSLLENPMPKQLIFKVRSTSVHHARSVSYWGPSGNETSILHQLIDENTLCITIPEHIVVSVVKIRIDNA